MTHQPGKEVVVLQTGVERTSTAAALQLIYIVKPELLDSDHDDNEENKKKKKGDEVPTAFKATKVDLARDIKDEYDLGEVVGKGAFGVFHSSIKHSDNSVCAVKYISVDKVMDTNSLDMYNMEASWKEPIRHANIAWHTD